MGSWASLRPYGGAVTVVLNQAALKVLLDSQEGPVGRFVQRTAEAVVAHAQSQFDDYFDHVLPARQDIVFSMDGSSAAIGYSANTGSKSGRLARAEAEGRLTNPPIQQALDAVRNGG